MKIQAIVFDFFGVISVPSHQIFFENKVSSHNNLLHIYEVRRQHDLGYISMDKYIEELSLITQTSPEQILYELRERWILNDRLIDFMTSELRGKYKLGMLSNAAGDIRTFVPDSLLKGLFDDILISANVGLVKPNPEIFQLACERLGVEPAAAIMIDDIEENAQGARDAGLQAITYETFAQFIREIRATLADT